MEMREIGCFEEIHVLSDIAMSFEGTRRDIEPGVTEYRLDLAWDPKQVTAENGRVHLRFFGSEADIFYMWHPGAGPRRVLEGNWSLGHDSMLSRNAPIGVLMNGQDRNRMTVAASEVRKRIALHVGIEDSVDVAQCDIRFELSQFGPVGRESLLIRVDKRDIRYEKAIADAVQWWDETLDIQPMPVPAEARMPLYSSWYAFHQDIRQDVIEQECAAASALDLDAIILDDGWQTDHNWSGYLYTGDWRFTEKKFPDFKAHVQRVHAMGMKYILWFSLPYVGMKSEIWPKFTDRLLCVREQMGSAVLDPRYPDVRVHLISLFERFLREYDLDGFKLDFIDEFALIGGNEVKPEMDFVCVQEAAEALMQGITDRLRAIKPDVLIEFRQSYIGPMMRRFGNMFRVGDCATDITRNRVGIADLRLLAPDRAIHGDMLSWNNDETAENAALQLLACMFGVIQLSKVACEMTEEHKRMCRFWLDFARKHEKLLQEADWRAEEPQQMYPILRAFDENEEIVGVYARNKVVRLSARSVIRLINAKQEEGFYAESETERKAEMTVYDTFGTVVAEETILLREGVNRLACPRSGLVELRF